MRRLQTLSLALPLALAGATAARAEPVFLPGLYQSETRSATTPDHGTRQTECLASRDAEAFRRDTLARYATLPQFRAICRLSASRPLPDGFAFAMDCGTAKTIVTYRLTRDAIRSVVETAVAGRPEKGSILITLWQRVGNCGR